MNTHRQSHDTTANKKGNSDIAKQTNPTWWNKNYGSNWDRVKDAFRRNFEENHSEQSKHAAIDDNPRGAVADTNRSMNQEHHRNVPGDTSRNLVGQPSAKDVHPMDNGRVNDDARSQSAKGMGKGRDEITEPGAQRETSGNGDDWSFAEREGRYGFGARDQYPQFMEWNPELESTLRSDWDRMKTGRSFEDARAGIRRGWEFSGQQRH